MVVPGESALCRVMTAARGSPGRVLWALSRKRMCRGGLRGWSAIRRGGYSGTGEAAVGHRLCRARGGGGVCRDVQPCQGWLLLSQ